MVGHRMDTDVISRHGEWYVHGAGVLHVSTRRDARTYAYRPSIVPDGVGDIAAMARAGEKMKASESHR